MKYLFPPVEGDVKKISKNLFGSQGGSKKLERCKSMSGMEKQSVRKTPRKNSSKTSQKTPKGKHSYSLNIIIFFSTLIKITTHECSYSCKESRSYSSMIALPLIFKCPSVLKWVWHSPCTLIIRVQACVREISSDLYDHLNCGLVSVGPSPTMPHKRTLDTLIIIHLQNL